MTAPFTAWAEAGFGADLLPLCGPDHDCSSPGKTPHLPGWQRLEITPPTIERWARTHRGNLGLRTARHPALDLDIEDDAIVAEIERVALVTLGSTAVRVRANSARRLLLYRHEGEPFGKAVVDFTTPGGQAKVEILAAGQQCVVAGVHHTGVPIEWRGGQPVAAELAPISRESRDALIVALRRRLEDLGCTVRPLAPSRPAPRQEQRTPAKVIPLRDDQRDYRIACEALRYVDPDLSYTEWLAIGQALHARWPWPDSPGHRLWDYWSSRGEKYPGAEALARKWRSFHDAGGITLGSLIHIARQHGAGKYHHA